MSSIAQTGVERRKWKERLDGAKSLDISLKRKNANGRKSVIFTVDGGKQFMFIFEKRVWKETRYFSGNDGNVISFSLQHDRKKADKAIARCFGASLDDYECIIKKSPKHARKYFKSKSKTEIAVKIFDQIVLEGRGKQLYHISKKAIALACHISRKYPWKASPCYQVVACNALFC